MSHHASLTSSRQQVWLPLPVSSIQSPLRNISTISLALSTELKLFISFVRKRTCLKDWPSFFSLESGQQLHAWIQWGVGVWMFQILYYYAKKNFHSKITENRTLPLSKHRNPLLKEIILDRTWTCWPKLFSGCLIKKTDFIYLTENTFGPRRNCKSLPECTCTLPLTTSWGCDICLKIIYRVPWWCFVCKKNYLKRHSVWSFTFLYLYPHIRNGL